MLRVRVVGVGGGCGGAGGRCRGAVVRVVGAGGGCGGVGAYSKGCGAFVGWGGGLRSLLASTSYLRTFFSALG